MGWFLRARSVAQPTMWSMVPLSARTPARKAATRRACAVAASARRSSVQPEQAVRGQVAGAGPPPQSSRNPAQPKAQQLPSAHGKKRYPARVWLAREREPPAVTVWGRLREPSCTSLCWTAASGFPAGMHTTAGANPTSGMLALASRCVITSHAGGSEAWSLLRRPCRYPRRPWWRGWLASAVVLALRLQ